MKNGMKQRVWGHFLLAAVVVGAAGCGGGGTAGTQSADAENNEAPAMEGGLVAVPAAVRSNLGISFVKVESRNVARTLRVMGGFELLPAARQEYRAGLEGRIGIARRELDRVRSGDVLFTVDSSRWREHKIEMSEAQASIRSLEAELASFARLWEAHARHEESLASSIELVTERVGQLEALEGAGGGRSGELSAARVSLATARADLAEVQEKKVQLEASRDAAEAEAASQRFSLRLMLDIAASWTGETVERLTETIDEDGTARWMTIGLIEVRAESDGVVSEVLQTNGGWVEPGSTVAVVVDPEAVRFRATVLQSDLGAVRDGLSATIVPSSTGMTGNGVPMDDAMTGRLRIRPVADAVRRLVEVEVIPDARSGWAMPGVTGQLEINLDSSAAGSLAIPLASVQRDGLVPVFFRRNPKNPNEAIRVEADLGISDGRWVEVLSGVREGDEVVLDGGYQLMLATSGTTQKGGHFHADGTFHEGEH